MQSSEPDHRLHESTTENNGHGRLKDAVGPLSWLQFFVAELEGRYFAGSINPDNRPF